MAESNKIAVKAYLLYVMMVALMLVVVFRVIAIQYGDVVPNHHVIAVDGSDSITDHKERLDSISPLRGRILTDNGSVLVTSIPEYDLHMDLSVVKKDMFDEHVDSLAGGLADIFVGHYTKKRWRELLAVAHTDKKQYFKIASRVRYLAYQKVKELPILNQGKYKGGFIVERSSKRHKPHGLLARRTLGYVRTNAVSVGMEGAYDEYLAGEYGTIKKKKVNGKWRPVSDYIKEPINGADVITAIDINIQDLAENELMKQLEYQNAKHGSVVLMEVETGYIKAIANLTRDDKGRYDETYNHAVGSKTVPGSTFKLATLMALLEDGKANVNQIVNATGAYHFYDRKLTDSNDKGYGKISLKEAFEVSSNVIAKVAYEAYKSNPQTFIDRLQSFGLGDELGLDLMGEPKPTLNNVGEGAWSGISVPWMSIGYEVQQTPLQTLAFYNAVANGGEYLRPLFVKEVRKDGKVLKRFEKVVLKEKICSDQTLEQLKSCLEGVVENGTGKALKSSSFDVAGKTGTVILSKGEEGYSETSKYQASFCGYFPADNPKYSCIVVVAGPNEQIYGAQVSGVVFKAIADKVYANSLQYHESFNRLASTVETLPKVKYGSTHDMGVVMDGVGVSYENKVPNDNWAVAIKKGNKVSIEKRKINETKVPNLIGMPMNDAVVLAENFGLRIKVEGNGSVVSQSMIAGSKLIKGTQIKIVLK